MEPHEGDVPPGDGDELSGGKLFVGGLSWLTTEETLRQYFKQYGQVEDVLVMRDNITQRSRGFGFITFLSPSTVERVLAVPSHILDGKKIDPKPATPKSKSKENKTKKIFVGGVSQETSAEEVKKYFSQFGAVEEAVMLMDHQTKRHRGFGFITFAVEETVDKVCDIHFHTIKNKKVECKKAQPKESVVAGNSAALLSKRVFLNNFGVLPSIALPADGGYSNSSPPTLPLNFPLIQTALTNQIGGKMLPTPSLSSLRYSPYSLPSMTSTACYPNNSSVPAIQYSVANSIVPTSSSAIQSPSTPAAAASLSVQAPQSLNLAATLALAAALPSYGPGYTLGSTMDLGNINPLDWANNTIPGQGLFTMQ